MGSCPCLSHWLRFCRDITVALARGVSYLLPADDDDWLPDDPLLSG